MNLRTFVNVMSITVLGNSCFEYVDTEVNIYYALLVICTSVGFRMFNLKINQSYVMSYKYTANFLVHRR